MPGRLPSPPGQAPDARLVRRLQITSARLATALFAGEYRSAFRGRGIEFDEVREYEPGDDVRSIDWNVTARQGRPFVKRFVEERELNLLLLLDRSASMDFGTIRATKLDAAIEACALLAFAAVRSHDRMGLLTFGDGDLCHLPFGKGKRQALQLIRTTLAPATPRASAGDLAAALDRLQHLVKGRTLLCIFSDFIDPLPSRDLAAAAARHDIVAAMVSDPAEHELPAAGLLSLADAEGSSCQLVDSSSPLVRDRYRRQAAHRFRERREALAAANVDVLELSTSVSPLHPLLRFFRGRPRGRSR
jgi:uncharacterized protein (DUF58 family)